MKNRRKGTSKRSNEWKTFERFEHRRQSIRKIARDKFALTSSVLSHPKFFGSPCRRWFKRLSSSYITMWRWPDRTTHNPAKCPSTDADARYVRNRKIRRRLSIVRTAWNSGVDAVKTERQGALGAKGRREEVSLFPVNLCLEMCVLTHSDTWFVRRDSL